MAEELPCFSSSLCCLFFKILASLAFLAASYFSLALFRLIYWYIFQVNADFKYFVLSTKIYSGRCVRLKSMGPLWATSHLVVVINKITSLSSIFLFAIELMDVQ